MEAQKKGNLWPSKSSGYKLEGPVGQGSFGLVWKAICIDEGSPNLGQHVAVKIVDFEHFQDGNMEDIRKEIQIMSQCRHKNVVSYYVSFIDDSDLWLVMPLLNGGSVHDSLRQNFKNGLRDEILIATILVQVVEGLKYFHELSQIHRDIKAGNILMDDQGNIFISDFGVSATVKSGHRRTTFVGSPCWMAPEVMEQSEGYDFKADIWSLGITALELTRGEAPNADLPAMKVLLEILNMPPPKLPDGDWSQEFRNFVQSCLQKDPNKRPSCNEILNDHKKFFEKARDSQYIRQNFLQNIEQIEVKYSKELVTQAKEYLDKVSRKKQQKQQQDKKDNQQQKNKIQWDFGSSDYQDVKSQAESQKGKQDDQVKYEKSSSKFKQNSKDQSNEDDFGLNEFD